MGEAVLLPRLAWLLLPLWLAACGPPPPISDVPPPVPPVEGQAAAMPVVPAGYAIAAEAADLVDPRAITLASDGRPVVVEGQPARLTRIETDGHLVPIAEGGGNGPWTGAAFVAGHYWVAEAGTPGGLGGRILRVDPGGGLAPVVDKLPAGTPAALAAGADGILYVGIASVTNAGMAAPGSGRDIPCQAVELKGGRRIAGHDPCTGAVLRVRPTGGPPEVYAWGFRRPVGLAFAPDGRLWLAEQSYRTDPLRPVSDQPDLLWVVTAGVWYGWPDYQGQLALADPLLADVPNPPPPPKATLDGEVRALAVASDAAFGPPGEPYVAVNGTVAFVDPRTGQTPFAAGFQDPTAMAFAPDGRSLWVADAGTGRLWRIEALPR
jgi:glucose/arabinose dehydrogenase